MTDFSAQIANGKLLFTNQPAFASWEKKQRDGEFVVSIKKKTRTSLQNRSLHLLFTWMAESLNEKGKLFSRDFFKKDFETEWNSEMVKLLLWRPIMQAHCGKTSTTKLDTKEVGEIAEIIQRNFSAKLGIDLTFPNELNRQLGIKPWAV